MSYLKRNIIYYTQYLFTHIVGYVLRIFNLTEHCWTTLSVTYGSHLLGNLRTALYKMLSSRVHVIIWRTQPRPLGCPIKTIWYTIYATCLVVQLSDGIYILRHTQIILRVACISFRAFNERCLICTVGICWRPKWFMRYLSYLWTNTLRGEYSVFLPL